MIRAFAGVICSLGLGALLLGCPPNHCWVKVCSNGECSCAVDSCVDGASYDLDQKTCACETGRISVAGQCLVQADADEFCGKGYTYTQAGCTKGGCPDGQTLDEGTAQCVDATQLASTMGVSVGEGETIQCAAGSVLVVEAGSGACVPQEQTCAPDEVWNGSACVKTQKCATGSVYDTAKGACIAYATVGDDAAVVNVPQWAATSYGPDGGKASAGFCNKFARHPWRFGIPAGQAANVRVTVELAFAEGVIGAGVVKTTPSYVNNPTPVPPKGQQAVQDAANEVLSTLKKGGGKTNVPQAATTVTCFVKNAAAPVVVPATGGV
jgi:hypothetical protein